MNVLTHAAGHSLRSGQAAVSNADAETSNYHTAASPANRIKESGDNLS